MMMNKELSIYIHIPFCERKCIYCAFVSFCADKNSQDKYVDFLVKEIKSFKTNSRVKTIYIGGGTPSVLSEENLIKIFEALSSSFNINSNAEITIEANPNSLSENKLVLYKKLGINRLSIGIQSLNDDTLKKIGRHHSREDGINSIKLANSYFDNISIDLILGLEGEKNIYKYAETLIDLGVKHISAYMLEVHENTPLNNQVESHKFIPLNEDEVTSEYEKLVKFLDKKGFNQYEISNFALKGYESKHNINYWTFDDYVGFGISAHSFLNGIRIANASTLEDYYNGVKLKDENTDKTEIEERLFLGLRCFSGVDLKILQALGFDLRENDYYKKFLHDGILKEKEGKVYFNKNYYLVSDYIISHLLPD